MKRLFHERQIVGFINSLIDEFGLSFNQTPFVYVADDFLYSCLHKKNRDGETVMEIVTIGTPSEVSVAVHYDLRSDGSFYKGEMFSCTWNPKKLSEAREFIRQVA